MKILFFILLILLYSDLLGQHGFIVINPCPTSTSAIAGKPSLVYFNSFGNSYKEIHKSYASGKLITHKSKYILKNNKIKVKSIASYEIFPRKRWFKVVDESLVEYNRFWKPIKRNVIEKSHSYISDNLDSIHSTWYYYINKNDTSISSSYRETYNKDKKLIQWETTWNYLAYNDSTWKSAETSSSLGGVARVFYEYLESGKIKTIHERITSNSRTTEGKIIEYLYDDLGNIIEIIEIIEGSNKVYNYKFYYKDKLCVLSELYFNENLLEFTAVVSN